MNRFDIFIYIDGSDLEKIDQDISKEINDWLSSEKLNGRLVNIPHSKTSDLKEDDYPDWDLGVNFNIDILPKLSKIMDDLYTLGCKYNRDFVIGYHDKDKNISEDISFFGIESGKPKTQDTLAILVGLR